MNCHIPKDLFKTTPLIQPHLQTPFNNFLATYCVRMSNGTYLVRCQDTGKWDEYTASTALAMLVSQHQGMTHGGSVVSRDDIKKYLDNDCPVFPGWCYLPGVASGSAIIALGRRRANLWNDMGFVMPDDRVLADPEVREYTTLFLRLIRESLCNQPALPNATYEDYFAMAQDTTGGNEFPFTMQWLAGCWQRPGRNIQTNLWFIGETKGIGKGTLERVERTMMPGAVTGANQPEIERGWTNWVEGYLRCFVDEFDKGRNFDWGQFIKRETTNAIINLVKRNFGPYGVINITNWIFFTNVEDIPIIPEEDDRRNFWVQTTCNPLWKQLALQFNQWADANPHKFQQVCQAYAALLELVDVDWTWISVAPDTQIRIDNQINTRDAFYVWLTTDNKYPRDTPLLAREWLVGYYGPHAGINSQGTTILKTQQVALRFAKLARRGMVIAHRGRSNVIRYEVPSDKYPVNADDPEAAQSTRIIDIRTALS